MSERRKVLILIVCLVLVIGTFALWIKGIIPFWSWLIVFVIIRAIVPKHDDDPPNINDIHSRINTHL